MIQEIQGATQVKGRHFAEPNAPGTDAPARVGNTGGQSKGFRGDIQGLRAIAVSLVVVYHLWPQRLTGGFIGVDVFFVISGFLITSHLMKRPPKSWSDLVAFWMRRVKRLLPASFLVLATTLAAIPLIAPVTVWKDWASQIVASTFYVQNWRLASTSVDYLAADNAVSAVQHFWSLSVEEQFYLFWPVIIAVLVALAAMLRKKTGAVVATGVVLIVVSSLVFSSISTVTDPGIAYFSTFTRAWELAIGALAAVLPAASTLLRRSRFNAILAWIGLLAIAYAGVTYSGATPFPGYAAALPVLGTALVIWANASHAHSPNGLLGHSVSRFLGDHSYSIYLWHWPLIVFLPFYSGELGLLDKAAIIAATIVLSLISKRYVEDRFRAHLDAGRILTGGRFLLAGTVILGLLGAVMVNAGSSNEETGDKLATEIQRVQADVGVDCFGAPAMMNSCANTGASPMVPSPAAAKNDKSQAYADDCWSNGDYSERPVCTYGDGKVQVALTGNSHAGQWLPALAEIADRRGWTITTYIASICAPSDAPIALDSKVKTDGCLDYGQWVKEQTAGGKFDLIITSNRQGLPVQGYEMTNTEKPAKAGYTSYLSDWHSADAPIVVIRDSPFPGNTVDNVPDCLATSSDPLQDCSGTPKSWKSLDPLATAAQEANFPFVSTIDMTEYFCDDETCPAVIGSVVPYFDASHLTATFARTLTDQLERKIVDAVPSL
ncbi:acyltransferase family protein [Paeniglutamicibacter sulfureus]|uniref:acyltransferase family protein n=1 Tax=Paeniglutamicibacter sulfureus TaxID=43666 RepID=UPI0026666976|nr:acyltransferase family protein [Paeniglutamicibacter sulfureus]MDO2936050.1 acyltransferase family protein [Paeniglutamicibacter sulfureus]